MLAIIWASTLLFCLIASLLNFYDLKFKLGPYNLLTRNNNDFIYLFFSSLIFFVIFLLITSNRTGADIINYFNSYNYKHDIFGREIIYNTLKEFFFINGFTFFEFRAILTFFSGLLVFYTFLRFKVDIYFFALLYMPMLLFMDSMQFRNSISMCILIFASYILITNNSKISKTIFTFLIIISSQIHTVFLFYLSLLFFNTKFEKVITKLIAIVSLFIVIVTFANGNKPPFIENILNLVLSGNDERLTRYLTSGNFGFLIPTFLHLYSLFLVVFLLQKIDFTRLPKINIDFLKLIMYTNLVSVAIIPLAMMNMNFYRMFRSCFLFSMIGIISIIRSNSIDRKIKFEITLLVVILTLLWIGFETYNVTIPIWKPVFEGELFWK